VQKAGGTAAFIDAENALDVTYAGKLGVKTEDLLISQPDDRRAGRSRLQTCWCASGAVDVIVIDSVAAHAQGGDRGRDGRAADGFARRA